MKKRINTIDGKILVQGGTDNELKDNEIRVNANKSLTERVNGKVVSVISLRPITADDVIVGIYSNDRGDSTEVPLTIPLSGLKIGDKIKVKSKKGKPLYIGEGTSLHFLFLSTSPEFNEEFVNNVWVSANVINQTEYLDIYTID